MTDQPAIAVVDDEPHIRNSLATLLRSVGYEVLTFENAQALYDHPHLRQLSCLILDVRLPIVSGLDFQQRLVASGLTTPIIFMTGHGDIPMTVKAMRAGAIDFLPKPFRDQEMLDAVAKSVEVHSNNRVISGDILKLKARFESLSGREREIMGMATSGLMNKQIAGALDLSEITVKIHRGKLMRKMQATTFADLVKMAEVLQIGKTGQKID